jgi:hypothetical protein
MVSHTTAPVLSVDEPGSTSVEPVVVTVPAIYVIVPVKYLKFPINVVLVELMSMLLLIWAVQLAGNETVPVPISTIFDEPDTELDVTEVEVNDAAFIVPPLRVIAEVTVVKTIVLKVTELPALSVKVVVVDKVSVVAMNVLPAPKFSVKEGVLVILNAPTFNMQPEVKLKVPVPEKVHAPAVIVNAPVSVVVPVGILKVPLLFKLEPIVSVIAPIIDILSHTTVLVFIVHEVRNARVEPVVITVPAM